MIEKYHSVFELLERRHRHLEVEETENEFEESAVRAVMASVRECMGMNELALTEGRKILWDEFEDSSTENETENWEGKVEVIVGVVEEKSDNSGEEEEKGVADGLGDWEEV